MMHRETFVAILGAALAEADTELLREAKNLIFARERTLRTDLVSAYAPGDYILFWTSDRRAQRVGRVHHLNQFSLTVEYFVDNSLVADCIREVVPIERVLGFSGVGPAGATFNMQEGTNSSEEVRP